MILKPQEGPQEDFMATSADIGIYGGTAGAGKSYALLMEPLRHVQIESFGATILRRTMPQIVTEGGLWDTSLDMYGPLVVSSIEKPLRHRFESGAKIEFHQLQYDKSVRDWDGSQIPLLLFDELQHFTEKQFFAMLARNRSTCGIRPYCRATCNPDPDSFLRELLKWWINQETGYPIAERSGVIRWFIRYNNIIHWGDSKQELIDKYTSLLGEGNVHPKSLTFISAKITDNPALLEADPGYIANLYALPEYEKLRLLEGNWFARPSEGELFKRSYFNIIERDEVPRMSHIIRYWDRAATTPSDVNPDPDYTAGAKVGIDEYNRVYIFDVFHDRLESLEVIKSIKLMAKLDGKNCLIGIEKDPGSAGKMEADYYIRELSGYPIEAFPKLKSKLLYWRPLAAQAKAGNVFLVKGPWNEAFLQEAEGVTDGSQKGHDDQMDAASGGFMVLADGATTTGSNMSLNVGT